MTGGWIVRFENCSNNSYEIAPQITNLILEECVCPPKVLRKLYEIYIISYGLVFCNKILHKHKLNTTDCEFFDIIIERFVIGF